MKNKHIEAASHKAAQSTKDQAIIDGLSEIYHDDSGQLIDVKTLNIRKQRGLVFWLISGLVALVVMVFTYFGLQQLLKHGLDTDAVTLNLSLDHQPVAAEEFFLLVNYKNDNQLEITNAELHLTYPDEFIFLDSSPAASANNNTWSLGSLPAGAEGQLKIRAKLISELGKSSLVFATMRYQLQGFSTEYKKSSDLNLGLSDLGLDMSIVHPDSVLVGEKQKIVIKYRARSKYLDNFRLVLEPSDANNLEFIADVQKNTNLTLIKPWVWQVNNITEQEQELVIYYKLIDKVAPKQNFVFKFSYLLDPSFASQPATSSSDIEISRPTENFYFFKEQSVELEVVKNSLNLLLLINGSDKDQSIDFGQTLNYSISYNNKGETPLTNLSFGVIIDSDLVDWSSFKDKNHGLVRGNTVTWSADQIKELASLAKGSAGSIDFSLKLKEAGTAVTSDQVKSYAQFQSGTGDDLASLVKLIKDREAGSSDKDAKPLDSALAALTDSNKSNTIINKVNSDFQVAQSILYFNEDNIPVGAGPLPLEVDKDTSLRVYWRLSNSFHDLEAVRVAVKLPDYSSWQEKSTVSVGTLRYDAASREVIWELPKLAKVLGDATADFSLNFKPTSSQRNKIIVLLPACEATATDSITKGSIKRLSKVKTSKLEDDAIVRTVNLDAASGLVK